MAMPVTTDDGIVLVSCVRSARGYAFSGGGRDVVRVDVSADGGKSWQTAELKKLPQRTGKAWAWTLWEVRVDMQACRTAQHMSAHM